jgi:hypothetical protein
MLKQTTFHSFMHYSLLVAGVVAALKMFVILFKVALQ